MDTCKRNFGRVLGVSYVRQRCDDKEWAKLPVIRAVSQQGNRLIHKEDYYCDGV
jgi:hypothetical protein